MNAQNPEFESYAKEHLNIFGHLPMPDFERDKLCTHPMHDAGSYLIDAPGVDIEIPFEPGEVLTEDDEVVYRFNVEYQNKVDYYREWIAEEEAKIAFEERQKKGIKKYF